MAVPDLPLTPWSSVIFTGHTSTPQIAGMSLFHSTSSSSTYSLVPVAAVLLDIKMNPVSSALLVTTLQNCAMI